MVHMKKMHAVADVIGAIMLIIVMFSSTALLFLAASNVFVAVQSYHSTQVLSSMRNKENISVIYEKNIPPSALQGIIVTNYGIAVNITSLIEINQNGASSTPENIYLPSWASIPIYTSSQIAGITTSYGGSFFTNSSYGTGMVPLSIFGQGVEIQSPFPAGLYYVPKGSQYTITANMPAFWFVNGNMVAAGKSSYTVTANGPTFVSAIFPSFVTPPSPPPPCVKICILSSN